jgi:hypothetical protein
MAGERSSEAARTGAAFTNDKQDKPEAGSLLRTGLWPWQRGRILTCDPWVMSHAIFVFAAGRESNQQLSEVFSVTRNPAGGQ